MGFNLGVVKGRLSGMAGRVIESGKMRAMSSKAAISFMHAPPAGTGRYMGVGAGLAGLAGAGPQKAMQAMLRGQVIKGSLQGAAIGAGLNAGRTMFGNAYSGDRPLMSGVGGAAFRGAMLGSTVGSMVAPARAVFGSNSGAWRGLANGGHLAELSQGSLAAQRLMNQTGTALSMQRMENTLLREAGKARQAAARAAKG